MTLYVMRGWRAYSPEGERGGKVAAHGHGRRCAADGCATILSMYNSSIYCALHDRLEIASPRRAQSRPLEERTCPHCGRVFETNNPRRRFCSDRCRVVAFQRRKAAELAQQGSSGSAA